MKFQYYLQEPNFRVGNLDIQRVSRPKNYKHSFKSGRENHGFIYIVSGSMLDSFQNCEVTDLSAAKGDLIFVPKGSIYTGMYTEDDTVIKIIQFDLISGELPEYLSSPTKIDLPNARELVEAFLSPSKITPRNTRFTIYPAYTSSSGDLTKAIRRFPQNSKSSAPPS
jgi:hypothetical protein